VKSSRPEAFTLIELLVSLTVVAILAAILFPIFRSAMDAAKKSQCIQNMRQVGEAFQTYLVDYDERVPPVSYTESLPGDSTENRSWVQNLLPYVGTLSLFYCPADLGRDDMSDRPRSLDAHSDPGQEFFESSIRTDFGYNYLYLAPLSRNAKDIWVSNTQKLSRISDTSSTLLYVDSVWDRDLSGRPHGGGSYIVVPPCRYILLNGKPKDTFEFAQDTKLYFGPKPEGWHDESLKDWLVYGGAWPWHNSKFNVLFLDGRAKTLTLGALTDGCNFKPYWRGNITSRENYLWDLD